MVQTCCVKNCKERQTRGTTISFHQFPKDPELKQRWIEALKYENCVPSHYARVCSKHFASNCYGGNAWSSKRTLKADAVPNVSDMTVTLCTKELDVVDVPSNETTCEAARLNNELEDDNDSNDEENVPGETPSRKKRKAYIGDFEIRDVVCDEEKFIQIINATMGKKNKQIKVLKQKNRRLLEKIKGLHSLVEELRKNQLITEDVSVLLSAKLRLPKCYS